MMLAPPALCRRLIAAAAPLVPADRRADWTREWRTEAACLAARPGTPEWRIAVRCLGAFVHAAWLRWDRWRSEMLVQDLRLALRALSRRPLYAVVTVLTLALGIGANAAMFGAVQAVLLRPLPFPEPERLVSVFTSSTQGGRRHGESSVPDFVDWRTDSRAFRGLAAVNSGAYALTGQGAAEQVPGADVSGDFFALMGVAPLLGRTLSTADDTYGGPAVVVLGHGLWTRRFGADPGIVGRRVMLEGAPREVVGVMPKGFEYPLSSELWAPMRFSPEQLATQRGAHYLDVVGRLAPSVTLEEARAEMAGIGARLAQAFPRTNWAAGVVVEPLRDALVGNVRVALLVLMGAVGLVLVIVCVNVAGLALAQSLGRSRDLAIRRALGAGRARLILGVLVECALLGLAGGAGGLMLASAATGAMAASASRLDIPLLDQARVDGAVVAFTALLSVAAAVLFGALPAWQAGGGRDLASGMRVGGPQVAGGRRRARGLLIVTQTALAVMLLVGAGLLARSFAYLRSVDLGFAPANVQSFSVSLPEARYQAPAQRARFVEDLLGRVRQRPGVESAAAVFGLPLSRFGFVITTRDLDGRHLEDREQDRLPLHIRVATPDYFRTMGMRIVKGRAFDERDRAGSPQVVILSESAAQLLWPGADPLGHHVVVGTHLGQDESRTGGEVVGIVPDVRDRGPSRPTGPTLYAVHAQAPVDFFSVVVRTREADPAPLVGLLRADLAALDPEVPMFRVRTMEQLAADAVAQPRLYMVLLAVFAGTAVLLAALGLYGVLAQAVGQRTREIGIRMAVGAARREVVLLVMSQGGRLGLVGIAVGLAGAALVSRALSGLLFGVSPIDAPTYAAVGLALLAITLFASWLPARRASRVDPVRALRAD
jgi:putative ABC transport system permease protein